MMVIGNHVTPIANSLRSQQPRTGGIDVVGEIANVAVGSGSLYLQPRKRLRHDNRQSPRGILGVVEDRGECCDSFLRLNLHGAYVDKGQMLVPSTRKSPVRIVPSGLKFRHVSGRKKACHLNHDKIGHGIGVDRERWKHTARIVSNAARYNRRISLTCQRDT